MVDDNDLQLSLEGFIVCVPLAVTDAAQKTCSFTLLTSMVKTDNNDLIKSVY